MWGVEGRERGNFTPSPPPPEKEPLKSLLRVRLNVQSCKLKNYC